ncbi:hypothetical protein [Treponema sp. J25]|uniref:4'-phosphopantetheinyl transferase family protein n=1 Tax=Treponema sp. J25 TaxID=2094121 RepID=UPI0010431770|nr:hypothetical protein [Treponema sp. J25]MCX7656910.1 hypothetical protein [Treponemataceae bacterium]TCW62191.1 hypothetical protein C5O22_02875 [Treponema sp. J25]
MQDLINEYCKARMFFIDSGTTIFYFDLNDNKIDNQHSLSFDYAMYQTLCSYDKYKFSLIPQEKNRYRFVLQRQILYQVLSEYTRIPTEFLDFHIDPNGKPFLANFPISFNISHTQSEYVIAVGGNKIEVGIDIDVISKIRNPLLYSKFLFKTKTFNDPYLVLKSWTVFESYAKCRGLSLSSVIKDDSFSQFVANLVVGLEKENYDNCRFSFFQFSSASFTTLCELSEERFASY